MQARGGRVAQRFQEGRVGGRDRRKGSGGEGERDGYGGRRQCSECGWGQDERGGTVSEPSHTEEERAPRTAQFELRGVEEQGVRLKVMTGFGLRVVVEQGDAPWEF